MSQNIYTAAAQSAVIKFRDETPNIYAPTLQEAVIAFRRLAPGKKTLASIETAKGERFEGGDIDRLYNDHGDD